MNLAVHDMRHNWGRFLATSAAIGLLFTVVLAMAGIYQGLVDDATVLLDKMNADLWVVQKDTRGPFADPSRLDATLQLRLAAVPHVDKARSFTQQVLQRDHHGRQLRFTLVGLSLPEDHGEALPLIAGRALGQTHGELIADASLKLAIGEVVHLGRDDYRVVGLTKQVLSSGGDAVVFAAIADTQKIIADDSSDAVVAERARRLARLQATDLGRSQPSLEALTSDPRWVFPAFAPPPVHAVLLNVPAAYRDEVKASLSTWTDIEVFTRAQEDQLVLQGMVEKARMQLGLFAAILIVTSSLLLAAVLYNLTLEKKHDIAVLKLIGARRARIGGLVLQEAWVIAILAYLVAVAIGSQAFPHFPRRVVLTDLSYYGVGALLLGISSLASILGVAYALKIDPGPVLEG